MKSTRGTLGFFLAAFVVAGCEMAGSTDSERAYGKPVVALATIADAKNGMTQDLSPALPFKLPNYPSPLLRAGVEGFVDVRFEVSPDGSVSAPTVLKTTAEGFSIPVMMAVKTWQFPQLRRDKSEGRNVELVCRVSFSIQEYWRDSMGGDPGRAPAKGDVTPGPGSSSHSPTVTPR